MLFACSLCEVSIFLFSFLECMLFCFLLSFSFCSLFFISSRRLSKCASFRRVLTRFSTESRISIRASIWSLIDFSMQRMVLVFRSKCYMSLPLNSMMVLDSSPSELLKLGENSYSLTVRRCLGAKLHHP